MRSRYIGLDGIVVPEHILNKKPIDGFKVIYQPSGCLWRIVQLEKSQSTGLEMKFWPSSKVNTINWIKYEKTGLNMWYSVAGKLEQTYHEFLGKRHGECYEFCTNSRKFYYEGTDITNEVLTLIENREEYTKEDKFNIFIKYGSNFKLYDEYMYHVNLDEIIKFCSTK